MPLRSFTQVLFTIRDEEGTRDRQICREIEMALRWMPPAFERVEGRKGPENPPGIRALHDLDDGGTPLTEERLRLAMLMLMEAKAYYDAGPFEPYEGRNREASDDITILLMTLATAIAQSRGFQIPALT